MQWMVHAYSIFLLYLGLYFDSTTGGHCFQYQLHATEGYSRFLKSVEKSGLDFFRLVDLTFFQSTDEFVSCKRS